jgi:hypothetical protein
LIFATDKINRELAIFMIDEDDPENDNENMFIWKTKEIKN